MLCCFFFVPELCFLGDFCSLKLVLTSAIDPQSTVASMSVAGWPNAAFFLFSLKEKSLKDILSLKGNCCCVCWLKAPDIIINIIAGNKNSNHFHWEFGLFLSETLVTRKRSHLYASSLISWRKINTIVRSFYLAKLCDAIKVKEKDWKQPALSELLCK